MPKIAQFEAVARESLTAGTEDPFTFTLAGEEFVVKRVITAMDVIRMERSPEVASMLDLLSRAVEQGDGERERLEDAVDACQLGIAEIGSLIGEIVRAQTGRPTKKSSGSASGRAATSTPSSERATKVASLGLAPVDEPTGSAI